MFDQLRQRLKEEVKIKKEPVVLEPLRPEDISGLHLSWNSHFNSASLKEHLREFPGLSLRVRNSNDFIIGDHWRRRPEVGQIIETRSRLYRTELVNGLVNAYKKLGYGAVVIGVDEENDNSRFYFSEGFTELEQIVYYEKPNMLLRFDKTSQPDPPNLMPYQPAFLEKLLEVDHQAFPWLWWNSQAEFDYYTRQEGVVIYLAFQNGENGSLRPCGYFGFTLYDRWAHLDRLAVLPVFQNQKLGAYLLAYAIEMMAQRGARRVTLSTQETNKQSQRLYEGFSFQKVRSLEYKLVGKWLDLPPRPEK